MIKNQSIYPQLSEGTLIPTYGRDYKKEVEVIKDWKAGKDFYIIWIGKSTYCSIRDGVIGEKVKLRYNKKTQVVFYTITEKDFMKSKG
jgi:hypothetical protein